MERLKAIAELNAAGLIAPDLSGDGSASPTRTRTYAYPSVKIDPI
jgi:hypothetical protein